jgi:hypothetical protein
MAAIPPTGAGQQPQPSLVDRAKGYYASHTWTPQDKALMVVGALTAVASIVWKVAAGSHVWTPLPVVGVAVGLSGILLGAYGPRKTPPEQQS